jgi:hypothetical protein
MLKKERALDNKWKLKKKKKQIRKILNLHSLEETLNLNLNSLRKVKAKRRKLQRRSNRRKNHRALMKEEERNRKMMKIKMKLKKMIRLRRLKSQEEELREQKL